VYLSSVKFRPFKVPFLSPFSNASQVFNERIGFTIFIEVTSYNSPRFVGSGEASPLPGFHIETIEQVVGALENAKKKLEGIHFPQTVTDLEALIDEQYHEYLHIPSVSFALETAFINLFSEASGLSVLAILKEMLIKKDSKLKLYTQTGNKKCCVVTNAVASEYKENIFTKRYDEGYRTYKYKITESNTEKALIFVEQITRFASQYNDIQLRFDCNRLWDLKDGCTFFSALKNTDKVQYFEEPIRTETLSDYDRLKNFAGKNIKFALDESIEKEFSLNTIVECSSIQYVIFKPSLRGGIKKTLVEALYAFQNHKIPVITSCLDVYYGLIATIYTAYILDILLHREDFAHGVGAYVSREGITDEDEFKKYFSFEGSKIILTSKLF
jgi:L-alanine-DL-glutamate epimerase-like enolase superfamily enzyme